MFSRSILCPDGLLQSIPWAALPGSKSGTVLLEEYQLAVLPHAQFLLQALERKESAHKHNLLLVRDVKYDSQPDEIPRALLASIDRGAGGTIGLSAATQENSPLKWPYLPGGRHSEPCCCITTRGAAVCAPASM